MRSSLLDSSNDERATTLVKSSHYRAIIIAQSLEENGRRDAHRVSRAARIVAMISSCFSCFSCFSLSGG